MEFETALELVNDAMAICFGRYLSDAELALFRGAWNHQTYEVTAEESGYSSSYLTRAVGPKLWKQLSEALGEHVSKTSFRTVIETRWSNAEFSTIDFEDAGSRVINSQPVDFNETIFPSPKIDWGEAPDVAIFYGRQTELASLKPWIEEDRCRLVSVLGMGGMGKTTLVAKLVEMVTQQGSSFQTVIWRSLRNAPSLKELLDDIVPFVSQQQNVEATPKNLLSGLQQSLCLIVLDNMETILQAGDRVGCFRAGYEEYGELLRLIGESRHQSCAILTSREKPAIVGALEGDGLRVRSLQLSGSPEASQFLIEAKGLVGTLAEKQQLAERYSYSPLALKIVATSIQSLFDNNISLFLAEEAWIFNGLQWLLSQQFERLSPLEQSMMYWLAINREWTSIAELVEDIVPAVSRHRVLDTLESLSWRSLIETQSGCYTLQPVVMEYVTNRFTEHITTELETATLDLFLRYALIKTTVSDYIRDSQRRLILQPIADQLCQTFPAQKSLEQQIIDLLNVLRSDTVQPSDYGGGNLINLCCFLEIGLSHCDFSGLTIRHGYFSKAKLHNVNMADASLIHTVFTHTFSSILSVAFSPDYRWLAAGDSNGQLRVWRTSDYQCLFTVQGHKDWAKAIAFSPDGQKLASGGDDTFIRIWDIQSGQLLQMLEGHENYVQTIAFQSHEILISGSHDYTIKIWNIQTGKVIQTLEGHDGPVRSVAVSPDKRMFATGSSDCSVKLWNFVTGTCLATLRGHQERIWAVAWSPDGRTLASACTDTTVRLWDIQAQACTQILTGHSHPVLAIAFSPDGKRLASSSAGQCIKLWDTESGTHICTMREHLDWVWAIAFDNNHQLVSGGDDQTLKFWNVETGQCLKTLQGFANQIFAVAFHPTSYLLASGSLDGQTRLWNWQTGEAIAELSGHTSWVRATEFSPDGHILASGSIDRTIRLWDIASMAHSSSQPRHRCTSRVLQGHTDGVRSLAWSPDSRRIASGSSDHTIRIWNAQTGEPLHTLQEHTAIVRSVSWSPRYPILASSGDDELIRLWDTETGCLIRCLEGHDQWVLSVAWHPDGTLLASGGADHTIRLWDTQTGELLNVLTGHRSQVQSVCFNPDQSSLVSASGDSTIKLWNVDTGAELNTLIGHTNQVQKATFHPKGEWLASGSNDGTLHLWQYPTGECVRSLQPKRPYEGMNIAGIQDLTEAQKSTLKHLGAIERKASESPVPERFEHQEQSRHTDNTTVPLSPQPELKSESPVQSIVQPEESPVADLPIIHEEPSTQPSPALQIQCLGDVMLFYDGEPIEFTNERSQALFAYLLLQRHTPQSRQRIAFALYPDMSDSQSRTALRKDLFNLRQALPEAEHYLQINAKTIQWNASANFSLDVIEFESALQMYEQRPDSELASKQRDLEGAIALYSGDLLPSFDHEWVTHERERLRQRYLDTLDALIRLLQLQNQNKAAIRYGRQLLQADNLRESTYQSLMNLYKAEGDRATAIQFYHHCMTALREELGIEPSQETQTLYQQLLNE